MSARNRVFRVAGIGIMLIGVAGALVLMRHLSSGDGDVLDGSKMWPRPARKTGPPKLHEYVYDGGKVVPAEEAKARRADKVTATASVAEGGGAGTVLFGEGGADGAFGARSGGGKKRVVRRGGVSRATVSGAPTPDGAGTATGGISAAVADRVEVSDHSETAAKSPAPAAKAKGDAPALFSVPPEASGDLEVAEERLSPKDKHKPMGRGVARGKAPAGTGAGAADPGYKKRIDSAKSLQGGSKDDNENFDEYLAYRQKAKGAIGRAHELDITRRHVVRVTDSNGLPLPNATVTVKRGDDELWKASTCSDGTTIFFPGAVAKKDGQGEEEAEAPFTIEVSGPYGTGWAELDSEQSGDVGIALGVRRPALQPRLDLMFCLDTTGSMSDEIAAVQKTLRSVVAKISALPAGPSMRFGLVEYRDRGDTYVSRRYEFTDDIDAFVAVIEKVRAGGGGDTPESVNEALHRAVSEPEWDQGAVRLVLLVGDAPPHMDYEKDFSYADEAVAAAKKGVRIYTLAASGLGKTGEYIFRQTAQFTGAKFLFITYGGTTSHSVGEFKGNNLDDIIFAVVTDELAGLKSDPEGESRMGGEPDDDEERF